MPNVAKLPAARRRMICDSIARLPYRMPPWAFDGDKIIFVLGGLEHLELPPVEVPKKNGGRSSVRVALRKTSELDVSQLLRGPGDQPLKWTDARPLMQVLDIVLKHHAASLPSRMAIAAGVFDQDADHLHKLLGQPGYADTELWFGHRQSVVHTESGPLLQVDLACTTMLAPIGVLDFLCMKLGCNNAMQLDISYGSQNTYDINKNLKGKQVQSRHTGRRWKVRGLARLGADQTYFIIDEGTPNQHTTTVADYFQRVWNIQLQLPHLPCLLVGK